MRILICNERFLFRFGVDRVLLMLGSFWKKAGHEVIMMGNRLDPMAVDKCSDRFISIPEAPDYLHGNTYTAEYIAQHWDEWFDDSNKPDIAFVAGWPFYQAIGLLKEKCGSAIFHDYGAVPTEGMNEAQVITQNMLRKLRKENLRLADRVIAISSFLEETQSKLDVEGLIPTSYVHLGIDHLDMQLWSKEELNIEQNDVIKDIEKFKKEGYSIIFQPGRWENGNYKNSAAAYKIVERLLKAGKKVKVLVLSTPENMGEIPEHLKDNFYCMGFVDDSTMRKAMEISDVGMSPTLWEGFDLPLGEMQFLNKCMYVFNIGAHPEVAAEPYFMCETEEELAEKICAQLDGKLPFSQDELFALHEKFREHFTWQNCADDLLAQIEEVIFENTVLFIDVTNACHDTANSGVMRVTRKTSHFIQQKMNTVFIMWDDSIKKYVFPYPAEVELLCNYGGPDKSKIAYVTPDGCPRRLLDEVIDTFGNKKKIHLVTETVNYKILQEAVSYFHSKKAYVAAIFYDAIAVLRPELVSEAVSENHKKYMMELADCDLIIPIAAHNQTDLENYWKANNVPGTLVKTVTLAAEMDKIKRNTEKITAVKGNVKEILFVSTLEPRKNHIRFLNAFAMLMEEHPELEKKVKVTLVGNRYAGKDEIPEFVEDYCKKHNNVKWLGVVDDDKLRQLYTDCTLTAYPSEIEGFGMPIIESLWSGKPCMCSNQGSMGELGRPGGCCLTDVLDENAMKESLYKLITDDAYLVQLQNEATERVITTWTMYVDAIGKLFLDLDVDFSKFKTRKLNAGVKQQLVEYFADESTKHAIFVSNFYPPNFVGGAEIIAHNQAKTLVEDGIAQVMAFAVDVTGTHSEGEVFTEIVDDILVLRVAINPAHFDQMGINFFDQTINELFDEVCRIAKPQVVHCHNIIGTSLGIIDVAKKHGAKVCTTLHDNWGFCYKNTVLNHKGEHCKNNFNCSRCMPALTANGMHIPIEVRQRYFRRIFEHMDAYISPSSYLADSYIKAGFSYHKMHVLWNGINTANFKDVKKVPSEKIRITYVGYFGKHKGIELLIRAVGSLNNKDIEINLIGAGEEQDNYRKIATECGTLHQLRFWGKLANHDIINAYAETDIYCLPSIWPENQPVSITEAMACGIPVIASDLGGSKELVVDGVTGYIFETGDYKDLADKIQKFVEDRSLITKMGQAGKEVMGTNDFHKQVNRLNQLYDKLPDKEPTRGKKIMLFKGNNLPMAINQITVHDIMLLDWVILEQDYDQAVACVVLPGQRLTKDELACVKEHGIKLVMPHEDYKKNEDKLKDFEILDYVDANEMVEILMTL